MGDLVYARGQWRRVAADGRVQRLRRRARFFVLQKGALVPVPGFVLRNITCNGPSLLLRARRKPKEKFKVPQIHATVTSRNDNRSRNTCNASVQTDDDNSTKTKNNIPHLKFTTSRKTQVRPPESDKSIDKSPNQVEDKENKSQKTTQIVFVKTKRDVESKKSGQKELAKAVFKKKGILSESDNEVVIEQSKTQKNQEVTDVGKTQREKKRKAQDITKTQPEKTDNNKTQQELRLEATDITETQQAKSQGATDNNKTQREKKQTATDITEKQREHKQIATDITETQRERKLKARDITEKQREKKQIATDITETQQEKKHEASDFTKTQRETETEHSKVRKNDPSKRESDIEKSLLRDDTSDSGSEKDRDREKEKELIIDEDVVIILRNYILKNNVGIDLHRYDHDESYKALIFYKLNPLVCIERCCEVERLLKCRDVTATAQFARCLGLTAVGAEAEAETRPRHRRKVKAGIVESSSEEESEDSSPERKKERVVRPTAHQATTASSSSEVFEKRRLRAPRDRSQLAKPRRPVFMPKKSSVANGREYTSLEDHAIVSWLMASPARERAVSGNRIWRELQKSYYSITKISRSWHSLRNRYLRYILPTLGSLALPERDATRLRANAAMGELKGKKRRRSNSALRLPHVQRAHHRPRLNTDSETDDKNYQPSKKLKTTRNKSDKPLTRSILSETIEMTSFNENLTVKELKRCKNGKFESSGKRPSRSPVESNRVDKSRENRSPDSPRRRDKSQKNRSQIKSLYEKSRASRSPVKSRENRRDKSQENRSPDSPLRREKSQINRSPMKSLYEKSRTSRSPVKASRIVKSQTNRSDDGSPRYSDVTRRFALRNRSTPIQSLTQSPAPAKKKRRLYNPET